jgi:hypothetical protein
MKELAAAITGLGLLISIISEIANRDLYQQNNYN